MTELDHAQHLVDGTWRDSASSLAVDDPGDRSTVGHVAWGGAAEARAAADAAERALPGWSGRTARQRGDVLRAAADLLDERRPELSRLLAREAGKRLPEAEGELAFSGEYLRWFAEEVRRPAGSVLVPEAAGRRHLTTTRPAGVVLSLTPWNFPVSIQARKLAPMLAAGCTVVARVAEEAPLAATAFVRLLVDAGVPAGVLNLVHGPGEEVTTALLDHRAVRVVSFTGSTRVGRSVMARAARRVVRPLLELGGDAPFVVCADADLDAAVDGAVLARTRNTGQSCVAANRFVVADAVWEEFTGRLAERLDAMTIGYAAVPDAAGGVPDLGPLIGGERVAEVARLRDQAMAAGARLLTSRTEAPDGGAYLAPALLADVPAHVDLASCEVFGPLAQITRVAGDDEALAVANTTDMGLAAYVFTRDAARAWRFSEGLRAGIVGVNDPLPSVAFAPMGGTDQSGMGREGASLGLRELQDVTYVAWRD